MYSFSESQLQNLLDLFFKNFIMNLQINPWYVYSVLDFNYWVLRLLRSSGAYSYHDSWKGIKSYICDQPKGFILTYLWGESPQGKGLFLCFSPPSVLWISSLQLECLRFLMVDLYIRFLIENLKYFSQQTVWVVPDLYEMKL